VGNFDDHFYAGKSVRNCAYLSL